MEDGLAGRPAAVDADVETVWLVFFLDGFSGGGQGIGQSVLFFGRSIEPVGDVAFGDEQSVAGADRVFVPQTKDQVGFEEDLGGVGVAEGAHFC